MAEILENVSESEAIEALLNELDGENAEVENAEVSENAENVEAKNAENAQAVQEAPKEPSNAEIMEAIAKLNAQQPEQNAEIAQEQPPELSPEQLVQIQALKDLGLEKLPEQLKAQQEFIEAQKAKLAEQQELTRRKAVFDENVDKFKKEFPGVDLDDFAKFINSNNYGQLLDENYQLWQVLGKAMVNMATQTQKPDAIIASSGNGTAKSAFSKLKDGDEVSDIELGAELLNL